MRTCPQCRGSFGDANVVCPDDHTELVDGAALTESQEKPLLWGTELGSYRILELLGEGGMGSVYRAEHMRLGRKVAIKRLRTELAANPKAATRFFSEARAVNQIAHENIIQITDFVDDQGPEKYYIMELLHGESLANVMRELPGIPLRRLLRIAIQVCDALAAVHEAGMVHRDLKPENIFLIDHAGQPDFVKLLDFGVVKLGNLGANFDTRQTADGSILGTPEYMSPEQVSSVPVDHRTDIYALGVVLYEGVTGKQPFASASFGETVVRHLTVKPPRPSSIKDGRAIPAKLETLILQCLAKDRENRPQSMLDVQRQLRDILNGMGGPAEAPRASRRWPVLVGATLVLLTFAAGVAYVLGGHHEQAAPLAAAATTVEVAFASTPPGAQVFVQDMTPPLGTTPFSAVLPRAETPRLFRFELRGYQVLSQEVALLHNTSVAVVLAEEPAAAAVAAPVEDVPQTSKRPAKRPSRRGTINPFD